MRKLSRHLVYLAIWIGVIALAVAQMPADALGCGGLGLDPELLLILRPPTPFAYQLSYVVWLATPLVIGITLWAVVRLLHRKRPQPTHTRKGGYAL